MNRALQPASIDGIEFDALIDSEESYTANAPTYPTEDASAVTDSMILEPLELSMTLYVTNTPVTWKSRHGSNSNRISVVVASLIKLFQTKKLVTVSTTERDYSNMVITSMTIQKSTEQGYAREIPITLQEITVVSTKTTMIDASHPLSGGTMTSTGNASTKKASDGGGNSSGEYAASNKTAAASVFDSLCSLGSK